MGICKKPVETKMYYCKSRYYVPEWCRWLNGDHIGYLNPSGLNGMNLFAYCGNNPVMYVDENGDFAISAIVIGAIIGFLTSYIPDVISKAKDGFEWSDLNTFEDNWLKYIGAALGGAACIIFIVDLFNKLGFMDNKIIDGMKKEGKPFRNVMIFGLVLFLLTFVYMYVNNKSLQDKGVLSMFIVFLMFGILGLYGWLYAIKYSLKINEEKIILKTLFRKVELNITDIINYTCKRYRKSVFYQFRLYTKEKSLLISTRYKEEFIKILEESNIKEKELNDQTKRKSSK